jgi:prophage regulatory protein
MQSNLLRPKQAASKAAISISHLYELVARGNFPKPIKISERITAFIESEVDAWINEKIQATRTGEEA